MQNLVLMSEGDWWAKKPKNSFVEFTVFVVCLKAQKLT